MFSMRKRGVGEWGRAREPDERVGHAEVVLPASGAELLRGGVRHAKGETTFASHDGGVKEAVIPAALVSWLLVIAAVCLYSAFISADSAALTSGILDVAPPASRGTAMAMYSTLGFAAATAGTFAVGALLDLVGGESTFSWTLAFLLMGAPNLVGAIAVSRASR